MTKKKFELLNDKPLSSEKDDQFDHSTIAEVLVDIVNKAPSPFTFGLFGKWGVGKTSIIRLMQQKVSKETAIIYFDCWKYENDSLRRAFLRTVQGDLRKNKQIRKNYDVEDALYRNIATTEEKPRYSLNKLKLIWPSLLYEFLIGFGIIYLFSSFRKNSLSHSLSEGMEFTLLALVIPLLQFAIQNIDNLIVTDTRQVSENSLNSPEQFEEKFTEIVNISKPSKFIFIFDNIDRSTSNRVIETLSTIKTYLETDKITKKLTFIIPCDDVAIKRHIRKLYIGDSLLEGNFNESIYADEYLRKFFNGYIRIPEFVDLELEKLTRKLLKQTNISSFNDEDLAYIVTSAFRDNPRQIKQFINLMVSYYLLIDLRISKEEAIKIHFKPIISDLRILAKYLVISTNYGDKYEDLRASDFSTDTSSIKTIRPLVRFLNASSDIDIIPHLDLLSNMKISSFDIVIKNSIEIGKALQDRDFDYLKNEIHRIINEDKLQDFQDFTSQLIIKQNGMSNPLQHIAESILHLKIKEKCDFTPNFLNSIFRILVDLDLQYFANISSDLVFKTFIKKADITRASDLFSKSMKRIVEIGGIISKNPERDQSVLDIELITNIISVFKTDLVIDQKHILTIRELVDGLIEKDHNVLEYMENNPSFIEKCVTRVIIENLVNRFNYNNTTRSFGLGFTDETFKGELFNYILNEKYQFSKSSELVRKIITVFNEALQSITSDKFHEQFRRIILTMENYYSNFENEIDKIEDNLVTQTRNHLSNIINRDDLEWSNKMLFGPVFIKFTTNLTVAEMNNSFPIIIKLVNESPIDDFKLLWSKLSDNECKMLLDNSDFTENFTDNVIEDFEYLISIWDNDYSDILIPIVDKLIQLPKQPHHVVNFVEMNLEENRFPKDEIVGILISNLLKIDDMEELSTVTTFLNETKCLSSDSLIESYTEQLFKMIQNVSNQSIQDHSLKTITSISFIGSTTLRTKVNQLSQWVIQHLETLDDESINGDGYYYPLQLINYKSNLLMSRQKRELSEALFSTILVHQNVKIQNFKIVVEFLKSLRTKFNDFETYYNEVKEAMFNSSSDRKISLAESFLELKPIDKIGKNENQFWKDLLEINSATTIEQNGNKDDIEKDARNE